MSLSPDLQKIIDSIVGKRVMIRKPHPRAGEYGVVKEFSESIGITHKPGFLIEADDKMRGDFYIFSGEEVHILPNP